MFRPWLAFGIPFLLLPLFGGFAGAAELSVPHYPHRVHAANCGPCGCLRVFWQRHRDIRATYGLNFDPRNYDQTEPHFYLGPVRGYPRYVVEGVGPVGPGAPRCLP
jgi:hypothetical protein